MGDQPVRTTFLIDPNGRQEILIGTSLLSATETGINLRKPNRTITVSNGQVIQPRPYENYVPRRGSWRQPADVAAPTATRSGVQTQTTPTRIADRAGELRNNSFSKVIKQTAEENKKKLSEARIIQPTNNLPTVPRTDNTGTNQALRNTVPPRSPEVSRPEARPDARQRRTYSRPAATAASTTTVTPVPSARAPMVISPSSVPSTSDSRTPRASRPSPSTTPPATTAPRQATQPRTTRTSAKARLNSVEYISLNIIESHNDEEKPMVDKETI